MTPRPGHHLRFDPDLGCLHVHSDEELASGRWRRGADCSGCPEHVWDRLRAEAEDNEATMELTQAERKRGGP